MVLKSLEQLKKERNELLRKKRAKDSLQKLARERKLEQKKISAEIRALKNPRAYASFSQAKELGLKFKEIANKRLDELEKERKENEKKMKRSKSSTKSRRRKTKTTSTRNGFFDGLELF